MGTTDKATDSMEHADAAEPQDLAAASKSHERAGAERKGGESVVHEPGAMLSDEELEDVYGGLSINWEIDW